MSIIGIIGNGSTTLPVSETGCVATVARSKSGTYRINSSSAYPLVVGVTCPPFRRCKPYLSHCQRPDVQERTPMIDEIHSIRKGEAHALDNSR